MLLWVGLQADALSGMKRDSSGLKPDPRLAGRFTHVRPVWHNRAPRGVAQPGSALALGARCREFKSLHPDQPNASAAAVDRQSAGLRRSPRPTGARSSFG